MSDEAKKDDDKPEAKKAEDKKDSGKAEATKPEAKKDETEKKPAADKKADETKAEDKKAEDKKAEDKKAGDKKAGDKKADVKVEAKKPAKKVVKKPKKVEEPEPPKEVPPGRMVGANRFLVRSQPDGYWTPTKVFKGANTNITVDHQNSEWQSDKSKGYTTADGYPNSSAGDGFLLKGSPEGMLIGKVGGDENGGGSVFPIGSYGLIPKDLEGRLFLSINDDKKGFGDNQGQIVVVISEYVEEPA